MLKNPPPERRVRSLGGEDALEKEMATHSSILAWRIPQTEEPGELRGVRGVAESDMTERARTKALRVCLVYTAPSPWPLAPPAEDPHSPSSVHFFAGL